MPDWKNLVHTVTYQAERGLDWAKHQAKQRFAGYRSPIIVPYRGYGTDRRLYLKGRVLEDPGLTDVAADHTVWQNLQSAYRRFESDEIPGARVRARFGRRVEEVVADEEGYFEVHLNPSDPVPTDSLWHEVELTLLHPQADQPTQTVGEVLVPPDEATFGVISDMDDTVLQTGATNFLTMFRRTVLQNAHTRMPFEGVAAFYRALQHGTGTTLANPLFYVSSSPWNLYDFLVEFLQHNGIPAGPILLRDLGIDRTKFIKAGHHSHKLDKIERVLRTFPDLPFILVGDSGQEDPEIYKSVVEHFPGRIRAIYIRDVSHDIRDAEVRDLIETVERDDVDLLLVADTEEAARHAIEHGFIRDDALPEVQAEKAKDEAAAPA